MKRFPTRTLVLMVLTLLAFGWMYWQTHENPPPKAHPAAPVPIITLSADASRAELEQVIAAALDAGGGDR